MSGTPDLEQEDWPTSSDSSYVEEWTPTLGFSLMLTLIATVLTVAGVFLFLWIQSLVTGSAASLEQMGIEFERTDDVEFILRFEGVLILLALSILVFPVHEWIHGLAFRYYGARPVYGAAMFNKVLPVLYCSAPGSLFTRKQYAVIVLAPVVVMSGLGVLVMAISDLGHWLIIPLAVNFGGAAGDLWFAGMLLRKEPGTLIEDHKDRLLFHRPKSLPGSEPA